MWFRDLQRLGELQTELVGAADFCATYLRCQLLLMKVPVFMSVLVSCSVHHVWLQRFSSRCTVLRAACRWSSCSLRKQNRCSSHLTFASSPQALQDKLWNMAVPLCLKQNVTATAAAQQVRHTHACVTTPVRSFGRKCVFI